MIWPFMKRNKAGTTPKHHPAGYSREASGADVFDPALQHYGRAFVKGEPTFSDASRELAYRQSRREVFDHCLRALAASPLGAQFVLRGSATLELWFGELARCAKDIDLVVRDARLLPKSDAAQRLLADLLSDCTWS